MPNARLLLVSQMKVPGKAWLEFLIRGRRLIVVAHFYPNGIWGRLYWQLTRPVHKLIFPDIAAGIIKRARRRAGGHPNPSEPHPGQGADHGS